MNQKTNGEKKYLNAKERLAEFEKVLDDYLGGLLLQNIYNDPTVEVYLSLDRESLNQLSIDECDYANYILTKQALIVQKEQNRNKSRLTWAKYNLLASIAGVINNYGTQYTPYECRKQMAINESPHAQILNDIVMHATIRSDELDFVSGKINMVSKAILEVKLTKQGRKYDTPRTN